jgi:MbtH protein
MADLPLVPGEMTSIDGDVFVVLVNDEGQHSLWPAGKKAPSGWAPTGPRGSRSECLAYVETRWTDMRPRSLREAMREPDQTA